MIHYVVFALALVSACAGDDPSVPVLENELSSLIKLMADTEARINATAYAQITAITNSSISCWAAHLQSYKNTAEQGYTNNLGGLKNTLQVTLQKLPTMSDSDLSDLVDKLINSGNDSLNTQLSNRLAKYQNDISGIMNAISNATSC